MKLLKDIYEGWGNLIKDKMNLLDIKTKEMAEERLLNCHFCHIRNGLICSSKRIGKHKTTGEIKKGCGCVISAKALAPDSRCPLGRW
jgi:hypothetical protein